MAVALDSSNGNALAAGGAAPGLQTWAFTNTAGGLVVFLLGLGCGSGLTTSNASVSYGGNAMTMLTEKTSTNAGSDSRIQVWYLLSAPTGANNFTFTPSASGGVFNVWGAFASFTGHKTTTPLTSNFASASDNGTTASTGSVTTASSIVSGNYFVGVVGQGAGNSWTAFTPGQWFSTGDGSSQLGSGRAGAITGSGAVMTVTGSWSGGADHWVAIGMEIAAAAGSASPPLPNVVDTAVARASSW